MVWIQTTFIFIVGLLVLVKYVFKKDKKYIELKNAFNEWKKQADAMYSQLRDETGVKLECFTKLAEKMNEMAENNRIHLVQVAALEEKIVGLNRYIIELEHKVLELKQDVVGLKAELIISDLKTRVAEKEKHEASTRTIGNTP